MRMPPYLLDVKLHAPAEVNRRILFAHTEALIMIKRLVSRAIVLHVIQIPLNHDKIFVSLGRRSPIPKILMAGVRSRQSVLRPKLVDGSRFAVISSPDSGFSAFGRRQ